MPKVGGKRKKARTHKETTENEETSTGQKIAKTFILKRGDIPNPLKNIIGDLREVMYPHTAMKMRESTKDKLKDYIQVGGGFGVTHMVVFSATTSSNYLRFIKLPEGPTLTFKILSYSSHKDLLSTQKKPRVFGRTLAAPLLILNGFNNINPDNQAENAPAPHHYNLVNLMIQNMFPPLDLAKAKIHNSKKAVLFNLNHESDTVDFRYYGIKVHQAGINKNIKQILEAKKVPNLKNFKDISEYILRENDYMSENDMEDVLEDKSKDEKKADKMTVKLYEIGPRMTLKLIKIEEGMMRGNVVYHRIVHKTQEEIENNRRKIKEKAKQKELARQKQQEVVDAKTAKKLKKEEEKKKREFLEDKAAKGEKEDDEYNKETEIKNTEEEEEKGGRKKPFDLSKGKAAFASEDEEEDEEEGGEEDEGVEEEADEYDEEDLEAGEDEEEEEIGADFNDEEDDEEEDEDDM